jgi:hypothetical protein
MLVVMAGAMDAAVKSPKISFDVVVVDVVPFVVDVNV